MPWVSIQWRRELHFWTGENFHCLLDEILKTTNRYTKIACEALIPALIQNGVAFEAHAQNVLARFDIATKELRGFVIRDLGGLRIHPPTLRESTGVDFQFLPGHCVATKTLEEIFPKFYHTFVHNHIQRLIRLLGLHHNGVGWEILRKRMEAVIPEEHPVWKVWMASNSTSVDSKCLMRMRMRDSYRDVSHFTTTRCISNLLARVDGVQPVSQHDPVQASKREPLIEPLLDPRATFCAINLKSSFVFIAMSILCSSSGED